MLSPSVRCLELAPERGPLSFLAGQWLNVYVPGEHEIFKRAYSIASPVGRETLELVVTHVPGGAVSPLLHALPVGASVEIDGPHGLFTRAREERREPALFVATGTGIAPFRSMLLTEREDEGASITLLFGCRTRADILFGEELSALAQRSPRFSLEVTLSRPEADWTGRKGYVQTHLSELVQASGRPRVYACGLTRMTSEVRRLLKEQHGYDRRRIHTERYD
jgi:ferredoxin-NADP reductase